MSPIFRIFIIALIFGEVIHLCDNERFSDKIDIWSAKHKTIRAFKNFYSKIGNSIINIGRASQYFGMRTRALFANKEFVLGEKDAEYFFYGEQKARDRVIAYMKEKLEVQRKKRDEAKKKIFTFSFSFLNKFRDAVRWLYSRGKVKDIKKKIQSAEDLRNQEYFCDDPEPNNLLNYCRLALNNKKLKEKIPMTLAVTQETKPECQIRSVYLSEYNFESERKFLRCPIVKEATENAPEIHTYIYISSVENPPANRLRYYMFMSPELDPLPESPRSPSSPPREDHTFLGVKNRPTSPPRQPESNKTGFRLLFFRKEKNSNQDTPKLPLEIVTLVINKDTRSLQNKTV